MLNLFRSRIPNQGYIKTDCELTRLQREFLYNYIIFNYSYLIDFNNVVCDLSNYINDFTDLREEKNKFAYEFCRAVELCDYDKLKKLSEEL
jgi:hypothetical protein